MELIVVFLATAAVALMVKGTKQQKVLVKRPTHYDEGMEAIKLQLNSPERLRLARVDELFERFFRDCANDLSKMRRVSNLLDQAMCLSMDLDTIEKELVLAVRDVAGPEMNLRVGSVATAELMILLRRVVRQQTGGVLALNKRS